MRLHRAIGFVDLCGFTAFTERHSDEQVVLVLAQLRAALREAAARRGVRVVKWLGDGAMVSSTTADALVALMIEVDHRMAAAVPSLAVRAGVDEGPVIMFEGDDYIGTCVNIASRLCDQATPHGVLSSPRVAGSRPAWVASSPTGPVEIRGITDRLEVHILTLAAGGTATDPICGLPIAPQDGVRAIGNVVDTFCTRACADLWAEAAHPLLVRQRPATPYPSRTDIDLGATGYCTAITTDKRR